VRASVAATLGRLVGATAVGPDEGPTSGGPGTEQLAHTVAARHAAMWGDTHRG
jgi:hypothetical protein